MHLCFTYICKYMFLHYIFTFNLYKYVYIHEFFSFALTVSMSTSNILAPKFKAAITTAKAKTSPLTVCDTKILFSFLLITSLK